MAWEISVAFLCKEPQGRVGVGLAWDSGPNLGFAQLQLFPAASHCGHSSLKAPHPILLQMCFLAPKRIESTAGFTLREYIDDCRFFIKALFLYHLNGKV